MLTGARQIWQFGGFKVMKDGRLLIAAEHPWHCIQGCVQDEPRSKIVPHTQVTDETIAASCDALARDLSPIDDLRSRAEYRLRVASNLLAEFGVGRDVRLIPRESGSNPCLPAKSTSQLQALSRQ